MTQNTVEFMRKYADIINEAQQPEQLTEGMLDTLVQKAKGLYQKFADKMTQGATAEIAQILGKQPQDLSWSDVTLANAKKLVSATGVTAPQQQNEGDTFDRVKSAATGAATGAAAGAVTGAGAVIVSLMAVIDTATIVSGMPIVIGAAIFALIFAIINAGLHYKDTADQQRKTQPTPASKINPVNRTAVAPTPTKPQTDINGNPI